MGEFCTVSSGTEAMDMHVKTEFYTGLRCQVEDLSFELFPRSGSEIDIGIGPFYELRISNMSSGGRRIETITDLFGRESVILEYGRCSLILKNIQNEVMQRGSMRTRGRRGSDIMKLLGGEEYWTWRSETIYRKVCVTLDAVNSKFRIAVEQNWGWVSGKAIYEFDGCGYVLMDEKFAVRPDFHGTWEELEKQGIEAAFEPYEIKQFRFKPEYNLMTFFRNIDEYLARLRGEEWQLPRMFC